jgi:hypothetical protein
MLIVLLAVVGALVGGACAYIEHPQFGRLPADYGLAAIPKSVRPARIAENIDIFDFVLTADDIAAIDTTDTGVRGGPNPEIVDATGFKRSVED